MDKSRVEPTIFFIEKISFSLKLFSGHFYGQSFIKTVRGPWTFICSDLGPNSKQFVKDFQQFFQRSVVKLSPANFQFYIPRISYSIDTFSNKINVNFSTIKEVIKF